LAATSRILGQPDIIKVEALDIIKGEALDGAKAPTMRLRDAG